MARGRRRRGLSSRPTGEQASWAGRSAKTGADSPSDPATPAPASCRSGVATQRAAAGSPASYGYYGSRPGGAAAASTPPAAAAAAHPRCGGTTDLVRAVPTSRVAPDLASVAEEASGSVRPDVEPATDDGHRTSVDPDGSFDRRR